MNLSNEIYNHQKLSEASLPYRIMICESDVIWSNGFFDDSYFMGRTEAVIRKALSSCGANLVGTFVFYDGCIEKRPWVTSMYRYYDNYDVLGHRLEK